MRKPCLLLCESWTPLSLSSPAQCTGTHLSTHQQGINIYDEKLMWWLIGFLELQVGALCTGSILCEEGVLSRRAVCESRERDLGLLECSGRLPFTAAARMFPFSGKLGWQLPPCIDILSAFEVCSSEAPPQSCWIPTEIKKYKI